MDTYLDGLRAVYRRKCNLMADGIRSHFSGKVKWEMPQGGLFLWCTLPDDCDMPAFCTKQSRTTPSPSFREMRSW